MLKRIYSLSVRSQLLVITLIIALPALGMIVAAGMKQRDQAVNDAYKLTRLIAERIATEQRHQAITAEQLLVTLSQVPEVKRHDAENVLPLLRRLLAVNPQYANILIADARGNVWASVVPFKSRPNVADRRYFKDAVATGKLAPGEYIVSRTIDKPAFNFAYPYRDSADTIGGVIVVGIALDSFTAILAASDYPRDTNFLLVDHNGIILNRALHPDVLGAGTRYPEQAFRQMVNGPDEYSYRGRASFGDDRFITYRKIRLKSNAEPYMYVRVGIPVAAALATANRTLHSNLLFFGLVLLGSYAAANYVGRKSLVERIEIFKDAVLQISSGGKGGGVSSVVSGGELGSLAHCFDAMSDQLHHREQALADTNQRLHSVIANAPVVLFALDAAGTLTFSDGRGLNSLGLKPGQAVGLSAFELYADSPTVIKGIRLALQGESFSIENTIGEKVFEVWYSPHYDSQGAFVGVIGVATEITERKIAEQALRESEQKFRNLVDNLQNAVVYQITGDNTGRRRFIYISRAVERLNEVSVEDVLADAGVIYRQMLPEYHETLRGLEEEAIRNESSLRVEVQCRLPSGRLRWFEYTVVPRRSGSGQIVWDGIEFDVTERKAIEEEFRKAKTAAEAANIAKTEFLANMSHEIRTPMNGVIGNAQLLRFTSLSKEQEELLANIETDAKSLVEIINDVLDISKIEAGKLEIEPSVFSLAACLSDLIKPLEHHIRAKNLTLIPEIGGDVPDLLVGDQLRIKQILRNLLGNAVKFTETGGIRLQVEKVSQDPEHALVRFSVSDTGIGIKREALEKLFTPFSQADASVTRRFGGTGLGLSICSRLAGLMGGEITVESVEGEGSTFRVTLPLKVDGQPVVPRDSTRKTKCLEGRALRILLVDDSQTNRVMMASLLQHIGHQVSSASNGLEALEVWRNAPFDIILMDIQMPVMDGIEAAGIIRGIENTKGCHTPIIALTAHALTEQREHLLKTGFDGYVSKPIDLSALQAEIRRLDMADCQNCESDFTID